MSATPWPLREADPNWRNDHDYAIGSCKRGSNGKIYFALQASGPNSGGEKDPVSTTGYWVSLADSLKSGGTNALELDAIGAAPASHTSVAATTTVPGHVKLGTTAGTACQGNDARLSNARTPTAHKATHKTGGSDALLPEEIGAARGSRISATTPATAGWYRIAQSAGSISNCMGLFEITGAVSGAHSVSLIAAGLSYGKGLNLIQLAHAPWSDPALTKARIVYHPTYSGNFAYLEVYLSQAKAISLGVNLLGGQGWTLVAPSTAGAVPSGYSVKELTLAEGKIVANVNGSLSGNAATATKLATARTIALSGDATASGSFDGSGNLTLTAALKNSGATAGAYGPTANATPAFNATFSVPQITVDAKGRVTSAVTRTVKIPANPVATQRANGLLSAVDKKALDYGEAFRLSMIGVPRFWRSTTLPAGHVWANGDLVLFADWPELKKVYDAGGFNGMLLAYNANATTIAANLGKWRPNSATPTGLFTPKMGDQFFRAWEPGTSREAGSWQGWASALLRGQVSHVVSTNTDATADGPFFWHNRNTAIATVNPETLVPGGFTFDTSRVIATANENRPVNVALPIVLYLGLSI